MLTVNSHIMKGDKGVWFSFSYAHSFSCMNIRKSLHLFPVGWHLHYITELLATDVKITNHVTAIKERNNVEKKNY